MSLSFSQLKKTRTSYLDTLRKEATKVSNQSFGTQEDGRFWKPEVDKTGNAYAVFRFLPIAKDDDLPWIKTYSHGFKGPGGWYIENCPTTIGGKCPCCDANSLLWNSGIDADKDIARTRKRRLSHIANIFVVSDPKHPENDEKVFLYRFGKKIFDKVNDLLNPQFPDESPVDPFCPWAGANFILKQKKVDGYPNYEKAEFDKPSPLFGGDDEKIEEIWNLQHSLKQFIEPSIFKSFAELEQRLNKVLGNVSGQVSESAGAAPPATEPKPGATTSAPKGRIAESEWTETTPAVDDGGEEEDYFSKLANDD